MTPSEIGQGKVACIEIADGTATLYYPSTRSCNLCESFLLDWDGGSQEDAEAVHEAAAYLDEPAEKIEVIYA